MSDFVTIATYGSPAEAAIMKGKLEAHDIFCYLADEHSIGTNLIYSIALGGVKLRVREEDRDAALAILGDVSSELKTEYTLEDGGLICPKCQSNHTRAGQKGSWLLIVLSFILGPPVPVSSKKKHCFHCGHEWW